MPSDALKDTRHSSTLLAVGNGNLKIVDHLFYAAHTTRTLFSARFLFGIRHDTRQGNDFRCCIYINPGKLQTLSAVRVARTAAVIAASSTFRPAVLPVMV
jgi:hypothetical protein